MSWVSAVFIQWQKQIICFLIIAGFTCIKTQEIILFHWSCIGRPGHLLRMSHVSWRQKNTECWCWWSRKELKTRFTIEWKFNTGTRLIQPYWLWVYFNFFTWSIQVLSFSTLPLLQPIKMCKICFCMLGDSRTVKYHTIMFDMNYPNMY